MRDPTPASPPRAARGILRAGAALAFLLASAQAWTYPGGIVGYSGQGGQWCLACHNYQNANYVVRVEIPPGPYTVHNTYELTFVGRRTSSFQAGMNAAVERGTLSKPANEGTDLDVTGNEGRHRSPRSSTATADGAYEVRWRLLWRPPALGSDENNVVRIFWASNGRNTNSTRMANVLTDGGTCQSNNSSGCGIPVTVERLPCTDDDDDGYFPTACLSDVALGGGDCDNANADRSPALTERCNGVDDDCDGQTDEGFSVGGLPPGSTCDGNDADACLDGTVTCAADGLSSSCVETVDNTERCNGGDDDCDGLTDEGYTTSTGQPLGAACDGNDLDQCATGVVECVSLTAAACVEGGPNHSETCNGQDDDCDGLTDEIYSGLGTACDGTDADRCLNGVRQCKADGTGTECVETVSYLESCNGADDDCDGFTDENYFTLGQPCDGADTDRCLQGTSTCKADGTGVECVNEVQSFTEQCNGQDDDCDFLVDEGCVPDAGPPPDAGSVVVDAGSSERDAGVAVDASSPDAAPCGLPYELCNDADDDCDGDTDEDFPDKYAPCDGEDSDLCQSGVMVCTATGDATECVEPITYTELCNGQDDDCDGEEDEGYFYQDLPVGQPCDSADSDRCANGSVTCTEGGLGTVCTESATFTETCNNVDDDCDGALDEGFPGLGLICDSDDEDQCSLGNIRCNEAGNGLRCVEDVHPQEVCNGVDDNCDGITDPDCAPDAGAPDASTTDASQPDAATPDAGFDAAVVDAGWDASVLDAGNDVDAADAADAGQGDASSADGSGRPFLRRDADAGLPPEVTVVGAAQGCSSSGDAGWGAWVVVFVLRRLRPTSSTTRPG
ncbi:MAG: putative metal-binding motif-containing protein [Myxococcota bacterium]